MVFAFKLNSRRNIASMQTTTKCPPSNAGIGKRLMMPKFTLISAVKSKKEFILPISGQVVRFSFPVINYTKTAFARTGVDVDPGKYYAADLAQNMDAIASNNLEDRRLRMVAKAGARLLLKGQITRQAEENFGVVGWVAGNVYGAVTETADTRGWTLLPGSFMVTRIKLKPGAHSLQIYTNGKLDEIRKVNVELGKIYFYRSKA